MTMREETCTAAQDIINKIRRNIYITGTEWVKLLREYRDSAIRIESFISSRPYYAMSHRDTLFIYHKTMPYPKTLHEMGIEEVQFIDLLNCRKVVEENIQDTPLRSKYQVRPNE